MKFFKFLLFLLFPFLSLHAIETIPALISCIEGVPEAKIADHVDAISGQYIDVEVDLYLLGPDPLVLQRNYESGDFMFGKSPGSWRLLSHCFLVAGEDNKSCAVKGERHVGLHAYTGERLGSFFCYSGWRNTQTSTPCILKLLTKSHILGLTNCARGEIGARTFPKNNQITYRQKEDRYEILSGDGTVRIYSLSTKPSHSLFSAELLHNFASCLKNPKFYHLEMEKLPSGNHILYSYDEDENPLSISAYASEETIPFSQITFEYSKNTCRATSDDGRQVVYHFDINGKLVKVERSEQPDICYAYNPNHHRLIKKTLPNGFFLQIAYDKENRVSYIIDPDGEQGSLSYMPNTTKVKYPSGISKHFHYDSQKRLTAIDTYTQGVFYTKEC